MPRDSPRLAFTLLELAMVLAVTGLMVGFVLKTNQSQSYSDSECANITKGQLIYIQGAIERFARSNDRLPLPARRFVGTDGPTYGRESVAGQLTVAGGVTFGALPWQALQLPASFAGDCWGNKYTYMVTTALTTNASSGGYLDAAVVGNIARKTSSTVTADAQIAYAVISHGPDKLGAVKLNYDDSGGAMDRKWCTGSTDIAYTNCLATAAIVMDAPLNEGKDAGTAYFDDIVATGGKPKMLSSAATSNAYCWGRNNHGQLGDNTTTDRTKPTLVTGGYQFIQVATGSDGSDNRSFACGLVADGKTYCWGSNTYGQLGDGTTTSHSAPALAASGYSFVQIGAGSTSACGLTNAGAVYCWGNGSNRIVNSGSVANTAPVLVPGGNVFVKISVGAASACGTKANGEVWCWGSGGSGPLGNGGTSDTFTPVKVTGSGATDYVFRHVSTGVTYPYVTNCGIVNYTPAYCWGENANGRIGDTSTATNTKATPVFMPTSIGQFTKIASSQYHSCAIASTGAAYCWGNGGSGRMGNGGTANSTTPTAVTMPAAAGTFTAIDVGQLHACAIGALNGRGYCWGDSASGQTGIGGTGTYTTPTIIPTYTITAIATGYLHTCFIANTGNAYCAGDNTYGVLGNGTTGGTSASYVPVTMPGGVTFTSITSGWHHSCAIGSDNETYCWGLNDFGQLGDNSGVSPSNVPVQVSHLTGPTSFTSVSAGKQVTCGIGNDNQAYCWGGSTEPNLGQMGDGFNLNRLTPTLVTNPSGVTSWTQLNASNYTNSVCAVGNDSKVYCWGYNNVGQLGVGDTTARNVPTAIVTTDGNTQQNLTDGSCSVRTDSNAYCWGRGDEGQMGNNTFGATNSTPKRVTSNGQFWMDIAVAGRWVCALNTLGTAYCWGSNWNGGQGDGNTTDASTPKAVSGGHTFVSLSTGNTHICGTKLNGEVYCWGYNIYGEIGDNTVRPPDALTPTKVLDSGVSPLSFTNVSGGNSFTCAIDRPEYLYVADTNNHRIQKFNAATGAFVLKFGTSGTGNGQLSSPTAVWVDNLGYVYVVDYSNTRIQKFDGDGNYISKFAYPGGGAGDIRGITGDNKGNLWLVNRWGTRIKYTTAGVLVGTYGSWGSGDGQYSSAYGSEALDSNGDYWSGCGADGRIQKLNGTSGSFVSKFTSSSLYTASIAIDRFDKIWIANSWSSVVRKYDPNGTLLQTIGSYNSGSPPPNGTFNIVNGIAVDSKGNVWVTDYWANRIQKFNSAGTFQLKIGTATGATGTGNGEFNNPGQIAIGR